MTPFRSSTRSPASPMTRLMKSSSRGAENPSPSVTQWKNEEIGPRSGAASGWGLENTITSPRPGPWNLYASLLTSTRSPIFRVGSMDSEGMKKACTRNDLINSASRKATMISAGSSRRNPSGPFLSPRCLPPRSGGGLVVGRGAVAVSAPPPLLPAGRPTNPPSTANPPPDGRGEPELGEGEGPPGSGTMGGRWTPPGAGVAAGPGGPPGTGAPDGGEVVGGSEPGAPDASCVSAGSGELDGRWLTPSAPSACPQRT